MIILQIFMNGSEPGYHKPPSKHRVEEFTSNVFERLVLGDDRMESRFDIDEITIYNSYSSFQEMGIFGRWHVTTLITN